MTSLELLNKIFSETKSADYEMYLKLNQKFTSESPISRRHFIFIQKLIKEMPGQINAIEFATMNQIVL